MYKTVFQNSKGALLFAAMVLFSAVSMVGTSENRGVLPAIAERFGAKPEQQASAGQAEPEAPRQSDKPANVAGWYDPSPSVFGDYKGNETPGNSAKPGVSPLAPSAKPRPSGNPMTAPLSSTAIVTN